nr:hypothetical protein [Tanacetum cinerariifolium]
EITPVLSTKEPKDSLIMGDEHLDMIPKKESNEFIKSSVENLVPNPSESEDECECDVPDCDDSQTSNFSTFSNPLFDDSNSSDDESSHEEVIHEKRIDEGDCDLEEDIHFVKRLLYDNSSPRPLEEFNSENSNFIIESFSPSHILVEDFDLFMKEIDLFLAYDGSIPSGINSDYSNSEGDNLFLERLLHDDPIPLSNTLLSSQMSFEFFFPSSYPYPKGSSFDLTGFLDVDHAGCIDSRKSTSGGIQFLGDKLVSWMSKKQNCTAMSSAEAEYVALSASSLPYQAHPYYVSLHKGTGSKWYKTKYQLADMFTKSLPEERFKYLARRIGMRCLTPAELEVLVKESA